jgi:hypothetical protein
VTKDLYISMILNINMKTSKQIEKYLTDYLAPFVVNNVTSDIRFFDLAHRQISEYESKTHEIVAQVDYHKQRFESIQAKYENISKDEIVDYVSNLENVIILDIGSMTLGSKFGARVANKNKNAEVRVINPSIPSYFYPALTTGRYGSFKFELNTFFDKDNPVNSINQFYKNNNLENMTFHPESIYSDGIKKIAQENPDKQIIINFDRIGPENSYDLAQISKTHKNTLTILSPVMNSTQKMIGKDNVTQMINKYDSGIKDYKQNRNRDKIIDTHARLGIIGRAFLAEKISNEMANGSVVYNSSDVYKGYAFHHPTKIICSRPLKND